MSYPNSIDPKSYFEVIDGVTDIDSSLFNKYATIISALQNELGIKPSGNYSTVRQRLDAISATTGGQTTENMRITPHSFAINDKFTHSIVNPIVTIAGTPTVMPTIFSKTLINLESEGGFSDGYGLLYFKTQLDVDTDVTLTISIVDVTSAPVELASHTFSSGEHSYSVAFPLSIDNVDRIFEFRCYHAGTIVEPINTTSTIWNTRLLFIPDNSAVVGVNASRYLKATIDKDTIANGSLYLGKVYGPGTVQSVIIIIDGAFDGSTTISIGDIADTDRLMPIANNTPGTPGSYTYSPNHEYLITFGTVIRAYFTGTPTTGSGTIIVYYH